MTALLWDYHVLQSAFPWIWQAYLHCAALFPPCCQSFECWVLFGKDAAYSVRGHSLSNILTAFAFCLFLTLSVLLSFRPRQQQQSLKAKEVTEEMELAILKTCQSVSELRREVSQPAAAHRNSVSTWSELNTNTFPSIPCNCPLLPPFITPPSSSLTHYSCVCVAQSLVSIVLCPCLSVQLHKVAVGRASELLKLHSDHLVLQALKAAGGEGNLEAVAEYGRTLTEQREQLVEVSTSWSFSLICNSGSGSDGLCTIQ